MLNILFYLCSTISVLVFILAVTSPLTQKLLFLYDEKYFANPYHLYIASNLGSMVGLLGFVFVFEPFLSCKRNYIGGVLHIIYFLH